MATFAPEATKRSVIARPKPCAPPVTTAQRPFRSILFIALFLCSKRPAAVDYMGDACRERALVAGEVNRKRCDFLWRAKASHWLPAHEHLAALWARGGGADQHRGGFESAGADTVATDAPVDEID